MENQELLAAIGAMMDEKLNKALTPIKEELSQLQEGQTELREGLEEVRSGVNALLEWSEGVGEKFEMPLRPAQ